MRKLHIFHFQLTSRTWHHLNNPQGGGGLRGITNKPTSLLKYCLCAPELARTATETDELLGVSSSSRTHHHQLTYAKFSKRQQSVRLLSTVLLQCNPFHDNSPRLYNLMTKQVVPEPIEKDILTMEERGQQALQSFVEQRICGPTNLWERMPKLKFLTWNDACKTVKLKDKKGQVTGGTESYKLAFRQTVDDSQVKSPN